MKLKVWDNEKLMEKAKKCAKAHKDACEYWEHGGIMSVMVDEHGSLRIRYDDGVFFYYAERSGGIVWW